MADGPRPARPKIENWDWSYSLSLDTSRRCGRRRNGVDPDGCPSAHPADLIGGRFRFVEMRGPRFRYRQTLCNSFRLEMKLDPDDLPEGIELPT
jgi:hypothetical protein